MSKGLLRLGIPDGGHNFQRGKRVGNIVYTDDIGPVECSDGNSGLCAGFHHGQLRVEIRQVVRLQKLSYKGLSGCSNQNG